MWDVLFDDEFREEFRCLDQPVRQAILAKLIILGETGPNLGRPSVDTVAGRRSRT